ncbi:unnamed protein product [Clonostachys rosea]|uniref:Major facilitator superfamily (MFS) profile domain-containing protein n=1 Tax=Bionectria ochroleuca TaxID=29856 RepID=A0ABY6UHC7_BIOOC|nr:unnamed protein product [Clonostachys rosea]
MAFGILETRAPPPGTVVLERNEDPNAGGKHVILVPEPSNSPKDPLNMPRVRKELFFLALIYGACITGVMGPVLVPGFSIVASSFEVGLSKVALLNGALIMALGVSSYICAPLASVFGRRLVYLATTVVLIVACIWAALAQSYGSLIGARSLQGLGMGSFFAVAGTNSINDVFFVHQRGRRVGLWNFSVIVSVNAAPIISGFLITSLGWRWSFWMLAICFGVALIMVLAIMPETYFPQRDQLLGIAPEEPKSEMLDDSAIDRVKISELSPAQKGFGTDTSMGSAATEDDRVPVWKKILGIESIQFKPLSELVLMLTTPVSLLQHPVVLWSGAMWSTTFSWTIIQGAVADQIFAAPP